MSNVYEVPADFARTARVNAQSYAERYTASLRDPVAFWGEVGRRIDWLKPYTQVKDVSYDVKDFRIRWYADGETNVAHNCLDRHLAKHGDRTAILWEGDDPAQSKRVSYRELHQQVCRFANVLKGLGVAKGDRVTIYLPMIPEATYAM
ncbi:MAG: acetyl-coenzyme A synthetase N-terminal domain-containing protein, partial [Pseudomonadota bacterium]